MSKQTLRITSAGLLGLVVAALLGFAALELVTQPVGLSTVSASAGDELVSTKKGSTADTSAAKKKTDKSSKTSEPSTKPTYVPPQSSGDSGDDSTSGDDSSGSDSDESSGDDHGDDEDHDDD